MVSLCDSIFAQYDPLKDMAPEDRVPIAKEKIAPIVGKVFRFADFLLEKGISPEEEELPSEEEEIERLMAELDGTDDPVLKLNQKLNQKRTDSMGCFYGTGFPRRW